MEMMKPFENLKTKTEALPEAMSGGALVTFYENEQDGKAGRKLFVLNLKELKSCEGEHEKRI